MTSRLVISDRGLADCGGDQIAVVTAGVLNLNGVPRTVAPGAPMFVYRGSDISEEKAAKLLGLSIMELRARISAHHMASA